MALPEENRRLAPAIWRPFYVAIGLFFVLVGAIAVVVPLLPTTIFLILAVWSFKRSSPPLENWLLNHRVVGPTLRDWEETRSIRPRTKVIAITAIWVCLGISSAFVHKTYVYGILAAVGISLTVYLATRKSKTD